jgi:hypothetical protein
MRTLVSRIAFHLKRLDLLVDVGREYERGERGACGRDRCTSVPV